MKAPKLPHKPTHKTTHADDLTKRMGDMTAGEGWAPVTPDYGDPIKLAPGEIVTVHVVQRVEVPETEYGPGAFYAVELVADDGTLSPASIWENARLRVLATAIGETVRIGRGEDIRHGAKTIKAFQVYRRT